MLNGLLTAKNLMFVGAAAPYVLYCDIMYTWLK
jgi:hypothetical protein